MLVVERQEFEGRHDRNSGRVISGLELRECYFEGCSFSTTRDVKLRSTLRNSRMIGCSQRGSSLGPAIIEDVLVENLSTSGQLLQAWGAVFKHVTFRGKIDRLMLSPVVVLTDPESPINKVFAEANADYYSGVDWALDISQAEAKELEIQGIPSRLIRRDAETQVVVTADKAIKHGFDGLNFGKTHWNFSIQFMLNRGEPDVVLVAPRRSPKFKAMLDVLHMLRKEGVAEPD